MKDVRTWSVRADRIEHDSKHLNALIATMLANEGVEEVTVEIRTEEA